MTRSRSEDGQERSRRFSAASTNVEVNFFIGIGSSSEYNFVPNLVAASHISVTVVMKLVSVLDTDQILILKAEHHQA